MVTSVVQGYWFNNSYIPFKSVLYIQKRVETEEFLVSTTTTSSSLTIFLINDEMPFIDVPLEFFNLYEAWLISQGSR